jgi:hypothetical protein
MLRRKKGSVSRVEQLPSTASTVEVSPIEVAAASEPEELDLGDDTPFAKRKIVVSEDPRKEQMAQIARDYHDAMVHIIRQWLQEDAHKRAPVASGGGSQSNS